MPLATIHENPLTESELRWLWARYQRCGFAPGTFAKRFARNSFESLTTPKGRNMAVSLAFQYRRQIITPKGEGARLTWDMFVQVVKNRAAIARQRAGPVPETPLTAILRTLLPESTPDPQLSLSFA